MIISTKSIKEILVSTSEYCVCAKDNMSNLSNDGDNREQTPLLSQLQPFPNYSSQTSSSNLNNDDATGTTEFTGPPQVSLRPRSNTISSIVSGYQRVKENIDKKKFVILLLISISIYLGFVALFAPRTSLSRDFRRWHSSRLTTAEIYRIYLNSLQERNLAKDHLHKLTSLNDGNAYDNYIVESLKQMGFTPILETYYPWVSKPVDTWVKLFKDDQLIWDASLIEDDFRNLTNSNKVKGYNAYSPNGDVRASYVYCNYGTLNDYKFLLDNNIDIEGKIHVIKYGELNRGLKIKNAELYGASSVILFNDPVDDGEVTEKNGYLPFPNGPARSTNAIERGNVEYYTDFPGDPTTPNYPSKLPDTERLSPVGKLPRIPSIPLSVKDITPILRQLNNTGIQWSGKGHIKEFDYSSGPSNDNTVIQLFNQQNQSIVKVSNIIVEIPGIFQDGETIIAAHKDSISPINSASIASSNVILLEIARGLRSLLNKGWKPLRPIKLASWDGDGYGLVGSTEFVEEYGSNLGKSILAYLNLDNYVISGSSFICKSNPLLHKLIKDAAKYTNFKGQDDVTLFEEWVKDSNATIGLLDGTSDYVPFQYHLGIPSASFSFQANYSKMDAIMMSHSLYDNVLFIEKYVDPDFQLHNTMAMMVGLITLTTSENELHMFNTHAYFQFIFKGYEDLYKQIFEMFPHDNQLHSMASSLQRLINVLAWRESITFDRKNHELFLQCRQDYPIWSFMTKFRIYLRLLRINEKLKQLDTLFISKTGLSERSWLKHSLFASDKYTGIKGMVLPGIYESINDLNRDALMEWLNTLSLQLNNVRYMLQ